MTAQALLSKETLARPLCWVARSLFIGAGTAGGATRYLRMRCMRGVAGTVLVLVGQKHSRSFGPVKKLPVYKRLRGGSIGPTL